MQWEASFSHQSNTPDYRPRVLWPRVARRISLNLQDTPESNPGDCDLVNLAKWHDIMLGKKKSPEIVRVGNQSELAILCGANAVLLAPCCLVPFPPHYDLSLLFSIGIQFSFCDSMLYLTKHLHARCAGSVPYSFDLACCCDASHPPNLLWVCGLANPPGRSFSTPASPVDFSQPQSSVDSSA